MARILKTLAVIAATFVLTTSQGFAAVILSSYSAAEGVSFGFSDEIWEAFGFRTGADGTYALDTVTMRLSGLVAGEVSVSVYDSAPCDPTRCSAWTPPGQSIGELGIELVHAKADYEFAAQGSILLDPNTLYWVVFRGVSSAPMRYHEFAFEGGIWSAPFQSETGAQPSPAGARSPPFPWFGGPEASRVLGQDWMLHSAINLLEVRGTLRSVPEPATLALVAAALLGVSATRRREPTTATC